MKLTLEVRHLLLVSWETDRESVRRSLFPGLVPAAPDGRYRVSLVALAYAGGRLGRLAVPPFSQLNVRTYVTHGGEPAVFFLRAYVTLPGMAGALFGAPYRPARLRFEDGCADAPGLGVSIRYRRYGAGEPGEPGELGRHELGLFEAAGLRGFRIRRRPAAWERAALTEAPRADVLLALGFDLSERPSLVYARGASFETDVPPRKS